MINLPQQVAQNIDRFTGRTWLLPHVLDWWEQSDDRFFFLTGGPGTGKSMIAAWLTRYGPQPADPTAQKQLARVRALIKAVHFCQGASRNITPQAFAESIANQLTESVTGFAEAVKVTLADLVHISATATAGTVATGGAVTGLSIGRLDLSTLGDELSFDRAFTLPLKKLYEVRHSEPILLLVDALDEAQTYTGVTLPDLLSRLADLPAGVRILATTRCEPRVLKFFRGIIPCDLILNAPPDLDDVRSYATKRLTKLATVSDSKRDDFAGRLSKQAGGVFLYAAMVLDDLLGRPIAELPDLEIVPLPDGLSGLYHDFLIRELGKDERRWFDLYEPLLGLVAVGQGEGLSAAQLTAIVGKDIRAALRATRQYLSGELPEGPFRPFHKSFADFLLEAEHNVDYHIDAALMHRRIGEHFWNTYHEDWSKCDGYGLTNLAVHLFHGQQFDRLTELIDQNWMHAKVEYQGYRYDGFVGDLMLAWRNAHEQSMAGIQMGKEPSTLADCVRYALIRTSVTSLSSQYEPALVKRAVETGLWSLARALSVAAQVRYPRQRARLFRAALDIDQSPTDDAEHRRIAGDALPIALGIEDPVSRAEALCALAPRLGEPQKEKALTDALSAAQEISEIEQRVETLATIAPLMSEPQKNVPISAAVSALTSWFASPLRDARSSATLLPGLDPMETKWLNALVTIAPQLEGPLLAEMLPITRQIDQNQWRVLALAALAPRLHGPEKEAVLSEALAAVCTIEDGWTVGRALAALAPHLSEVLVTEALSLARAVGDEEGNIRALAVLAPHIGGAKKEEVLREALLKAQKIVDEASRASALAMLAPQLSGPLLADAVSAAHQIKNKKLYAKALTALAERLTGQEQETSLREILSTAKDIGDDYQRAEVLATLAPQLSGMLVASCLEAARAIEDAPSRAKALVALLPKVAPAERPAVIREALRGARRRWGRDETVAALAPQLSGALLREALSTEFFEDEAFCASALAAIARRISGPPKNMILRDAMEAVAAIRDERERAGQLAKLAPQLSGSLLAEALSAARAIKAEPSYVSQDALAAALTALAGRLSGAEKDRVVSEALSVARSIDQVGARAEALAALAPQLDGAVKVSALREALLAAREITGLLTSQGDENRAKVLVALAPELSDSLRLEALSMTERMGGGRARTEAVLALVSRKMEAAKNAIIRKELFEVRSTESSWHRAQALAALAPELSGPLLNEALSIARQIDEKASHAKVRALTALALQLSGPEKATAIAEVLSIAREFEDKASFALALAALSPQLSEPKRESILAETLSVAQKQKGDEPRMEILIALAPHLEGQSLADAMSAALEIKDEGCRCRAVEVIAQTARDRGELLEELQRYTVTQLWSISRGERRQVYELCANEYLFRPPFVSTQLLENVAKQIAEVGRQWRWL